MVLARICCVALLACFAVQTSVLAVETNVLRWTVSKITLHRSNDRNDAPVVTGISLHPSKPECVLVGDDHLLRVYDISSQQIEATLEGHTDWVRATTYAIDGSRLYSAGNDRKLLVWTRDDSHQYSWKTFAEEDRATAGMAISADGKYLATAGFGTELNVYEIESGNRVMQLVCPCADMRCVAFSPRENIVAAAGRSGEIRLWHLDTGRTIRDFQPHQLRVRGLAFTKDGEELISCSEDRTIAVTRFNKVISPTRISEKQKHKLMSLTLLDADRFAVGGADNQVTIWSISQLTREGTLPGHKGTVAALSANSERLISGGYDTAIRVWNWKPTIADDTPQPKVQFSGFGKP
jgi:WD40 repeat protein